MNKIRQLLTNSSMPIEQIAQQVGINNDRLNAISSGLEPSLSELRRIAEFFKVAINDFVENNPLRSDVQFKFRQNLLRKSDNYINNSGMYVDKIASTLELIGRNKSSHAWAKHYSHGSFSYKDAEAMAHQFRAMFFDDDQLSPLLSLPRLVSEKIKAQVIVVNSQAYDGACTVLEGNPFIFVSARSFQPKMLFTLAHEIGHLLVHQCEENFSVIDAPEDIEAWSSVDNSESRREESFVDLFASCLLMPSQGVGVTLRKIREFIAQGDTETIGDIEIMYLSRIYGVSFMTAALRCERLKLLPSGSAIALNEVIKKSHKSAEKRADELNLPPRSVVTFPEVSETLLKKVKERISQGEVSIGRASAIMGLTTLDLFSLNRGTLH